MGVEARRLEAHARQVVVGTKLAKHLLLAKAIVVGGRRQHLTSGAQPSVTLFAQTRTHHLALPRFHLQFSALQRWEGVVEVGLLFRFPRHISRLGWTRTHTTFLNASTHFSFFLLQCFVINTV